MRQRQPKWERREGLRRERVDLLGSGERKDVEEKEKRGRRKKRCRREREET